MSTHIIGLYEDLTKIIFELSSKIIRYAPYFFCCLLDIDEPHLEKASLWGFFSDQVRKTQTRLYSLRRQATGMKFWIYIVEGLYYLCSENKGTVQLCSFCTPEMRLCVCICKKQVFS